MFSLIALLLAQSLTVRPASLTLNPGQRATVRVNAQPDIVEASDRHTILELAQNGLLTIQAPPYSKDISILIRVRDEFIVLPIRVLDPLIRKIESSHMGATMPAPNAALDEPAQANIRESAKTRANQEIADERAVPGRNITDSSDHQNTSNPEENIEPQPQPARLVIGLTQSGASSAQASLHYFLDFYAKRPLNETLSLWGNVRIASAPQQLDIPVAQFAPDFLKNLGQVEVNKLVLAGEFLTGVEFHTTRTLGIVSFFGASSAFSDAAARARVFKTAPNQYLGLIPQDRERFYRQYGVGLRYTSTETGTFTTTIGQDQAVTAGRYHRPVLRLDTLYPLKRYGLYLFATATLALVKIEPAGAQPIAYELAPDIPIHDQRVTLRTIAAARDSYRIGIGIDLMRLLNSR